MEQGNLALVVKTPDVSDEAIARCKDMRSAIRLCIDVSGMPPKEIAYHLNIDSGHLSRMINSGDDPRHFPPDRLNELMDLCQNEIPLQYLAQTRGYKLEPLQTALEMEIDRLNQELIQRDEEMRRKDEKLEAIKEFIKEVKGL